MVRVEDAPYPRVLGIREELRERGRAVVAMDVDPRVHMNAMGTVHGGAIASLVDSAAGRAVASLVGEVARMSTIELKVNYLRPSAGGTLRAEGRVVHVGTRIAVVEVDVSQEGSLIAKALATYYVAGGADRDGRPARIHPPGHGGVPPLVGLKSAGSL
ncbi:MAG: PaaI family thioesterase [Nitrososphaeria archaeon]